MKHAISILFILLFFQVVVFAQTDVVLCPKISVSGGGETNVGAPLFFKAVIEGKTDVGKVEYLWKVSAGTITEGQGTAKIGAVWNDMSFQLITATVEIKGLPENCTNTASETGSVVMIVDIFLRPFDNVAEEDPRKSRLGRLENYLEGTRERPKEFYLIKLNFVGKPTEKQIEKRIKFTGNYLISRARAEEFKKLIFSIVESTNATTEYFIFDDYFVDEQINCKDCKIIKGADFYEKFYVKKPKTSKR